MKCIEVFNYTAAYYKPVKITDKWQIAYLNSCREYQLERIKKVDIHYKTDEAFVLLEGKAVLIGTEINKGKIDFELCNMTPGTTYNIPANTWHNIVLFENTRVLIFENANTHLDDYDFFHFNDEQTEALRKKFKEIL